MMRLKLKTLCVAAAVVAAATVTLRASDPVGAYCILDKVVMEPNDTEPLTVQLFGVFSFAVKRNPDFSQPFPEGSFGRAQTGDVYAAIQKGYVYYSCPKGKEAACQAEWSDLKKGAGKGQIAAFGTRWNMTGRVRGLKEAPTAPDVYSMNIGVIQMAAPSGNSPYGDLFAALQAASRAK